MKTFENLYIRDFLIELYTDMEKILSKWKVKNDDLYNEIKSQILKILLVIAEWYEKNISDVWGSFLKAKWYLWRVKWLLIMFEKMWYFTSDELEKVKDNCDRIWANLYKLINKNKSDK